MKILPAGFAYRAFFQKKIAAKKKKTLLKKKLATKLLKLIKDVDMELYVLIAYKLLNFA
jgi:hypothetical protein